MLSQTRKLRRLYAQKLKALTAAVKNTFGKNCQIITGAAGTSLALTIPCSSTGRTIKKGSPLTGAAPGNLKRNRE